MEPMKIELVKPSELPEAAKRLSAEGTHPLTAMFGRDERRDENVKGLSVYCVFENTGTH